MKTNLNDCKKLREIRSPSKSGSKRMYNENKGNLVNTNQLKVKNKKTI